MTTRLLILLALSVAATFAVPAGVGAGFGVGLGSGAKVEQTAAAATGVSADFGVGLSSGAKDTIILVLDGVVGASAGNSVEDDDEDESAINERIADFLRTLQAKSLAQSAQSPASFFSVVAPKAAAADASARIDFCQTCEDIWTGIKVEN